MISLEDARNIIKRFSRKENFPVKKIAVEKSLNRIVAKKQIAKLDLPPFDKSAMDGYAILENDLRDNYQLTEVVSAGKVPIKKLRKGETIQVMTGALLPEGTGRVVPIEQTQQNGDIIKIELIDKRLHVCYKGEDIQKGETIVDVATALTPVVIANLIANGITEIEVFQPPLIAVISTGDELVDSSDKLSEGKIMDSNGPLLRVMCEKYGYEVVYFNTVRDDLDATCKTLEIAMEKADVILFSGGVSMGEFDYVTKALLKMGLEVHFDKIAIKPGKPTTFATGRGKIVFGLPGNPVAVYLTFNLFVRYAIQSILGMEDKKEAVSLSLDAGFKRKRADRLAFVPCKLQKSGRLRAVEYNGSAHLLALLQASGFFIVPKGIYSIECGANVEYLNFV